MEKLKHNIVKIYGMRGEDWLAGLPGIIEQLRNSWELSELKPFSKNMPSGRAPLELDSLRRPWMHV